MKFLTIVLCVALLVSLVVLAACDSNKESQGTKNDSTVTTEASSEDNFTAATENETKPEESSTVDTDDETEDNTEESSAADTEDGTEDETVTLPWIDV